MRLSDGRLVLPSGARADVWPIWPVARRDASPWSDSNDSPTSVGAQICLDGWSGGSAASLGGGVSAPNLRHSLVLGWPTSLS